MGNGDNAPEEAGQKKGNTMVSPIERLRYHVSGAIERGEKQAIAGIPAQEARPDPYGYYARKALALSGLKQERELERCTLSGISSSGAGWKGARRSMRELSR
jgi:hypothetical protein